MQDRFAAGSPSAAGYPKFASTKEWGTFGNTTTLKPDSKITNIHFLWVPSARGYAKLASIIFLILAEGDP